MGLERLIKEHFVDAAANIVLSMPTFAALEYLVLRWDMHKSINSRTLSACICLAGFGYLNAKGRDIYRKLLRITDTTEERVQKIQDKAYQFGFGMMVNPIFYYIAGQRDAKELLIGSLTNAVVSLYLGDKVGLVIDCARDIYGLKPTHRMPKIVRNNEPLAVAGSAIVSGLLTYAVYAVR
jgi:hypothetical protein